MRTRTAIALLICCAAFVAAAQAAEPNLLSLVPAGSDVLVGINFQQILASDFGKLILAQAGGPDNPQLKEFVAKSGFNPLLDLHELVIASPAKEKPKPFFLLRGKFDAAKLAELAGQGGLKPADYKGIQILSKAAADDPVSAVAVVDPSLIVGGDEAAVRGFVDRRGQPPALTGALAEKAAEVSKANDIWIVMHAAPSAFAPEAASSNPMGELLKSIQQATLGLKFGTDLVLSIHAVAATEKDAQGLVSAVQLFSGMAAASQQDNKQVAALLQRLKVDSVGTTARLLLAVPEVEIEAAIKEVIASKAKSQKTEGEQAPKSEAEPAPKE